MADEAQTHPQQADEPTSATQAGAASWQAARSLAPGARLGRYAIVEKLGAGAMGVVYRAVDQTLERTVAIKILASGLLNGEDLRVRFRREALVLARLNHPHIAAVYDVGRHDGLDFIVMEFIDGESLAVKLRRGALQFAVATQILRQTAEALAEAHSQGVIHRDLKPANLMVTPKGQVKVLDFGLARLLASTDETQALAETQGILGTPLYMSPEQALGKPVDARSDLWSLGVVYYEALTGSTPFSADSVPGVMRAVVERAPQPLSELCPDAPPAAGKLLQRALEKQPARRYQTAEAMQLDAAALLSAPAGRDWRAARAARQRRRWLWAAALLLATGAGAWTYRTVTARNWARYKAAAQISSLLDAHRPLAAFATLEKAQAILPGDPQLERLAADAAQTAAIVTDPPGATVEVQDYLAPGQVWQKLGVTPLAHLRLPRGYFRWRLSKAGLEPLIVAAETRELLNFSLAEAQKSPPGMVYDPGGDWGTYAAFLGWLGPYTLPPFYIDRFEVTNADYQKFVDSGGYTRRDLWPATFELNQRTVPWSQGMDQFRDATGRPGPASWSGGHYPEGKANLPVSGVSWFEAAAYAAFAGKQLPVLAQWYQAAPPDVAEYTAQLSNMSGAGPAAVGSFAGIGPFGTYDMAGNVREWTANVVDDRLRFILGGSWKSPQYLSSSPEALSPFDRSDGNGFRCVRNLSPVPEAASRPFHLQGRDFAAYKPVSDEVFRAYQLLYAYPPSPLNAHAEGVVKETADWKEEKVTFDTAYGQRMAAYLFLPKRVRPPFQTILFFPSARVMFLPPDSSNLGDMNFFDYAIQSGRAVIYPVYQDTYERRLKYNLPGGGESIALTTSWYKDASRALDYLDTRSDIDSSRLAYMGVSMGSAEGVIIATLMQDRLKTAIFLDGGYFLQTPPPGGDQADFAPRMKKPVLMVNGRFDYTFPLDKAQDPLFAMLGTPPADKSHVVLDTPHDVTEQKPLLVKAVLDWLDRYLGRVGQ